MNVEAQAWWCKNVLKSLRERGFSAEETLSFTWDQRLQMLDSTGEDELFWRAWTTYRRIIRGRC